MAAARLGATDVITWETANLSWAERLSRRLTTVNPTHRCSEPGGRVSEDAVAGADNDAGEPLHHVLVIDDVQLRQVGCARP
jgi:hypothetical protein